MNRSRSIRGRQEGQPRITVACGAPIGQLGIGGSGYKTALALTRAGYQVAVVCPQSSGALWEWETRPCSTDLVMKVAHWTPLRVYNNYALWLQNNLFDWKASRLLGKPDAVYAYSDQALCCIRGAHASGIPVVLQAATTHIGNMYRLVEEEYAKYRIPQRQISRWMVRKGVREYQEADLIRAESSLTRDTLLAHGVAPEKVLHIPPSVDVRRFQPATSAATDFVVSFVGSFDLRKGVQYLLPAFDAIKRPGMRLILHGGSGSRPINGLLQPYRHRLDIAFRSGDPVPTYHESSVCVFPSIEDGFAHVVLEALACGVPVIVSENVGGKDAVVDGENGYIVPIRDSAAIGERIRHLIDHPGVLSQMRQRARETAERYTVEREGAALRTLFSRAILAR